MTSLPMPHEERVPSLFICRVLVLTGRAKGLDAASSWCFNLCVHYGFTAHYPESFCVTHGEISKIRGGEPFGLSSSGVTWLREQL